MQWKSEISEKFRNGGQWPPLRGLSFVFLIMQQAHYLVDLKGFVSLWFGDVQPSPAALIRAALNGSNPICVNAIPNRKTTLRVAFLFGGLEEIRTPDPRNANAMRSQLRYKPS